MEMFTIFLWQERYSWSIRDGQDLRKIGRNLCVLLSEAIYQLVEITGKVLRTV